MDVRLPADIILKNTVLQRKNTSQPFDYSHNFLYEADKHYIYTLCLVT